MASTEVLLLSILRAEAENPKPRIVHFWRKLNEGLQVQEENACCHFLTDATMSFPLHNGLMVPVERFVVSGMDPPGNVGGGSRFQIPLDSKLSFRAETASDTGSRGST